MYCKHCGNLIKTGAAFCSKCGAKVEPPKNERVHPENTHMWEPEEKKPQPQKVEEEDSWKSDLWLTQELEHEEAATRESRAKLPHAKPPKKKGRIVKILLIIVLLEVLVGATVYLATTRKGDEQNAKETVSSEIAEEENGDATEAAPETQENGYTIAQTTAPSAPQITCSLTYADQVNFYGMSRIAIAQNMVTQSSYLVQQDIVADNTGWSAFDGDSGTSWQEGAEGAGIGEYVKADFDREYGVTAVTFFLGNHSSSEWYIKNNRPKWLKVTLGAQEIDVVFPDSMEEYAIVFDQPVSADSIRVEVAEVYSGTVYDDTIIADIGVYAR